MPICTYACAWRLASLMLILAMVFVWSGEAQAHKRGHGHGHHRVSRHHQKHNVPLPPRRPPVVAFNPLDGKTDICLAMNAYFETDDNPYQMKENMFMVAFVNKHRADESRVNEDARLSFVGKLDKFVDKAEILKNHAVCLATYKAWQFSWTMRSVCKWCQKWIRLQSVPDENSPKWKLAQEMTKLVEEGRPPQYIGLDPELSRATSYFNPDKTKRSTACKYFYGPLVRLMRGVRIGRHQFYAIPTNEEQKLLTEVHNVSPEKIQTGVSRKGRPKWRFVSHSCDPVDALPAPYLKAFNP